MKQKLYLLIIALLMGLGAAAQPNLQQDADGYYLVSTAEDLFELANVVNKGIMSDIKVRQTDDIDLGGANWSAIGSGSCYNTTANEDGVGNGGFEGIYDGHGHIVSNFTIAETGDGNAVGFFGVVTGTVKNLGISQASFNATMDCRAGALAGTVTASGRSAGLIENCYAISSSILTSSRVCGGLVGAVCGGKVRNCYTFNMNLSGYGDRFGGIAGDTRNDAGWTGAVENCYTDFSRVTSSQTGTTTGSEANVSAARFLSGEIAYKLNGKKTDLDCVWRQNLQEDVTPVPDTTHGYVMASSDGYFSIAESNVIEVRDQFCDTEYTYSVNVICQAILVNEYTAMLDKFAEAVTTLEEFFAQYGDVLAKKEELKSSASKYAAYQAKIDEVKAYLEANPSVTGTNRDILDAYLENYIEPNETYPNGSYSYVMDNRLLGNETIAAETDFVNNLLQNAIATVIIPGTEITVTMVNYDFKDKLNGWTVETTNGGVTTGGEKSIMVLARGLNTNFSMEQTLEGLPNGVYVMRANAFERTAGDDNSQYHVGQLYLNGNANFVMTINEDIVSKEDAVDGVNCHITGSSLDKEFTFNGIEGYIPKYMVGASYAFNAGRYLNYTAVEVTDSTLTVGARNLGSGLANDWLVVGNIRLFYMGTAEQASEMLDDVLDGYVARGEVIRNFAWVYTKEAPKYPNMSEALKNELASLIGERATATTGEEKMELVNKFSVLFNNIYDCRKAYVEMTSTADEVSDAASILSDKNLIDKNLLEEVTALADKAWASYQNGDVSADEARAITEQLRAFNVYPEKDENGVYQLASARDLCIFTMLVNSGSTNINAVLTADIDLDIVDDFESIGLYSDANTELRFQYSGTFDGQGHVIKNLHVERSDRTEGGLFSRATSATIRNVGIENATVISNDGIRVGVLAGEANDCTIENCFTVGDLHLKTTNSQAGGLFGESASSNVRNCYTVYSVLTNAGTITNCRTDVLKDDLASGAFCYEFNEQLGSIVYYQTLDEDAYPVPSATHKVVYKFDDGTYGNEADVEAPVADLLDVVFHADGTAEDVSPMQNTVTRVGETSSVYYNETYQRYVARFENPYGSNCTSFYQTSSYENSESDYYKALADGHTLEVLCMNSYEGDIPNSETKPFSAMQAGGTGFLICTTAGGREKNSFTFLPNVTETGSSTWRWTTSGVVPESQVFYHVVGVWNKEEQKSYIYVNGELCNTIDAPGDFKFASSGCNWFAIGGDPANATSAHGSWNGDVAIARAYDKPLTAEEVAALWYKVQNPDGVQYILENPVAAPEGIYNLNGMRMEKPQKGINIINGKKTLVK